MARKNWQKRLKNWVAPTRYPGVWELKQGGHIVRTRVIDPTTGRTREVRRVLPEHDAMGAFTWLQEEMARIKAGLVLAAPQQQRFGDYSVSLMERKLVTREIKSARGRERWGCTLRHLITGTNGAPGFGELFLDQISVGHVEAWRTGIARLIAQGMYAPTTANGWLHILRHILKRARREFQLPINAAEDVRPFDTSEHVTYTEEQPNTLLPDEVRRFLACMREEFPQHYAITYLGFATGLRPSSLRPLRRKGATPDIRWDEGVLLVRRSHTLGSEVMETTKTGLRQRITLPDEVMKLLRWHVETQLVTPEQRASDLLFPNAEGGFRNEHTLRKPFDIVCKLVGLKIDFTPRGMRRTFNDVARAAKVESLVTRSISGHLTETMREHYSTVSADEQRESIGRVLRLVESPSTGDTAASRGGKPGGITANGGGKTRRLAS